MASPQCTGRRMIALAMALCVGVALSSCATPKTEAAEAPASSATSIVAPAAPAAQYDVSRIAALADEFPSGFVPAPPAEPTKLGVDLLATVGTVVSYGKPFTVDPPECVSLLKPVDGEIGSDSMHIRADGEAKRLITVDAVSPVTVPTEIPTTGCHQLSYSVEQDKYPLSGSVQQLVAPTIEGATTIALKFDADRFPGHSYSYAAIVDGGTYVDVQARVSSNYLAESVLSELLVKAVAAIRGE